MVLLRVPVLLEELLPVGIVLVSVFPLCLLEVVVVLPVLLCVLPEPLFPHQVTAH